MLSTPLAYLQGQNLAYAKLKETSYVFNRTLQLLVVALAHLGHSKHLWQIV